MPTPLELFLYCALVINVLAFFAFGLDKRRARLQRRRIPESTMIGLAFAAGLVGAWLGMKVFRHKTRKRSFQVKMVLVSVFNVAWIPLVWNHYMAE